MKRGNNNWNRWSGRGGACGGFQKTTDKSMFTVSNSRNNGNDLDEDMQGNRSGRTMNVDLSTELEQEAFVGWKLYFPDKSFKESYDLVRRIKAMTKHFITFNHLYNQENIEQTLLLPLDLEKLKEDFELAEDWPNFKAELLSIPTQTLACVGLAMHNIVVATHERKIYVRLIGLKPSKISYSHGITSGELITVCGIISSVEPMKASCEILSFKCSTCSTEIVVKQSKNSTRMVRPPICRNGCKARDKFIELPSSQFSIVQPKQKIQLSESLYVEDVTRESLEIELNQNIAGELLPGMAIKVSGVLKQRKERFGNLKNDAHFLNTYLKSLSAVIINRKLLKAEPLTQRTTDFLQDMKAEKSPFRLLVNSFCIDITGNEQIKAGLILALLSGNDMLNNSRSESHVLLIGDPGTGKSHLLKACAELVDGIYLNGPNATEAGLTARVRADGGIDAGALILSDGTVCCIDEFDKLKSEPHVLLEAMEQQTISITKCGVKTNSSSRTSVIAAANAVKSFYNDSKSISENAKISPSLLSRFDLIFTLKTNKKSSDSIGRKKQTSFSSAANSFHNQSKSDSSFSFESRDKSLNWLRTGSAEKLDNIPPKLLRVYIEYARTEIYPTMCDEATEAIQNFYIQLKSMSVEVKVQHITTRHLEALIRLTLARARADLKEEATLDHAQDVINLFKFTMTDFFPTTDKRKMQPIFNKPLSKLKQADVFYKYLQEQAIATGIVIFSDATMKLYAEEAGVIDYNYVIQKLNKESYILLQPGGYKILKGC